MLSSRLSFCGPELPLFATSMAFARIPGVEDVESGILWAEDPVPFRPLVHGRFQFYLRPGEPVLLCRYCTMLHRLDRVHSMAKCPLLNDALREMLHLGYGPWGWALRRVNPDTGDRLRPPVPLAPFSPLRPLYPPLGSLVDPRPGCFLCRCLGFAYDHCISECDLLASAVLFAQPTPGSPADPALRELGQLLETWPANDPPDVYSWSDYERDRRYFQRVYAPVLPPLEIPRSSRVSVNLARQLFPKTTTPGGRSTGLVPVHSMFGGELVSWSDRLVLEPTTMMSARGPIVLKPGREMPVCRICLRNGLPAAHPRRKCTRVLHAIRAVYASNGHRAYPPSPACFYCRRAGFLFWEEPTPVSSASVSMHSLCDMESDATSWPAVGCGTWWESESDSMSVAPDESQLRHRTSRCPAVQRISDMAASDYLSSDHRVARLIKIANSVPWPPADEIARLCPR